MSSTTYKTLIMQENYDGNNTPFTPLITQIDRITGCLTIITEQIIDELEGLEVLSPTNLIQVFDEADLIGSNNKYFVLYGMGQIKFSSNLVGAEILIKFGGKGSLFLDACRVATVIDSNGNVVETLHDVITEARTALDLIKTANDLVALDTTIKADIVNSQNICTTLENDTIVAEAKRVTLNTSISNSIDKKAELDISITTANDKKLELETVITNGNTLKTTLETDIGLGNTLHTNLGNDISTGGTLKTGLDNDITTGNTLKTDLDSRITSGGTLKTNLDTSISSANTSKTNLDSSITTSATSKTSLDGSISTANTLRTNLQTDIATGNTTIANIETAINNGDLDAKANISQPSWTSPTLVNSWVNNGGTTDTVGYMKDTLGFVHLKGTIKSGTTTTVLTLPVGYRPLLDKNICMATNSGCINATITSSGVLSIGALGSTYVSMDGIIFKSEQ